MALSSAKSKTFFVSRSPSPAPNPDAVRRPCGSSVGPPASFHLPLHTACDDMTSLAFKIFYSDVGQMPCTPLRADEVDLALQRLPNDLEYRLPSGSSVSIASTTNASIVIIVHSPAVANEIMCAVADSAKSFQLYAKPLARYLHESSPMRGPNVQLGRLAGGSSPSAAVAPVNVFSRWLEN
jgi:hypothetical protein